MRIFEALCLTLGCAQLAFAEPVDLHVAAWKAVSFSGIPPTVYSDLPGGGISMRVDRSASFLLSPFAAVKKVSGMKFQWRQTGTLQVRTAAEEATSSGDDMPLRIGLLVEGPAPWLPLIAPAWVKAVADYMHLSSDQMIYFVVGALHPPGAEWISPHSSKISYRALPSAPSADGWLQADASFAPLRVVGLWLMADGDDTQSAFAVDLRRLELKP